ncbi:brachyurin-like [Neocloeon triangulifer]|uniref:brachyurin-like n=1 Tax=Neocloeon triangulifer TaxID=2078957 RepID=UPI00286F5AF8|nr:brachyurin-like [Neocloeon triangulifer]
MIVFSHITLALFVCAVFCEEQSEVTTQENKDVFAGKNISRATMPIVEGKQDEILARMKKIRQQASLNSEGKLDVGVRIIKGRLAKKGEFPYQVTVIADEDEICGGSLVTNSHVLTAGHCVFEKNEFELIFGSLNEETADKGSVTLYSNKSVCHSEYNSTSLENDIAIIYLPKPVKETSLISTVKIPTKSQADQVGLPKNYATIAGWGRTSDASMDVSQVLKTVDLQIIDNKECLDAFGEGSVSSAQVCALGNNGDATCQGDSGGPLVQKFNDENIQIGLVSFGAGEGCEKGFPEVYTRVSSYLQWISLKTKSTPHSKPSRPKNHKKNNNKKKKQQKKAKKRAKVRMSDPRKLFQSNNG